MGQPTIDGTPVAFIGPKVAGRRIKTRCPVCAGPARRDRPDLGAVDSTCEQCGWHFTTAHRRRRTPVA